MWNIYTLISIVTQPLVSKMRACSSFSLQLVSSVTNALGTVQRVRHTLLVWVFLAITACTDTSPLAILSFSAYISRKANVATSTPLSSVVSLSRRTVTPSTTVLSVVNIGHAVELTYGTNGPSIIDIRRTPYALASSAKAKTGMGCSYAFLRGLAITIGPSVTSSAAVMNVAGTLVPSLAISIASFQPVRPGLSGVATLSKRMAVPTGSPVASKMVPSAYHIQAACSSVTACRVLSVGSLRPSG